MKNRKIKQCETPCDETLQQQQQDLDFINTELKIYITLRTACRPFLLLNLHDKKFSHYFFCAAFAVTTTIVISFSIFLFLIIWRASNKIDCCNINLEQTQCVERENDHTRNCSSTQLCTMRL